MGKLNNAAFAAFLVERWKAKDGYIMGAIGENPRIWTEKSWRIAQYADRSKYSTKQYQQALYWWKHCERVWDCQGLADGYVTDSRDFGKVNVYARNNYADWCEPKGSGLPPVEYRMPGTAVFWGDKAADIHHVAYLVEPVTPDKPEGDWYLIEARGVMYGVVRTRLNDRKPDYWGLMTKYFDYDADGAEPIVRDLKRGMNGNDVVTMQEALIRLGYDLGKYGADGEFGAATETALKQMQMLNGLNPDGIYGAESRATVEKLLKLLDENPEPDEPAEQPDDGYTVTGGSVWLWTAPPDCGGSKAKTVHKGDFLLSPAAGSYKPVMLGGELYWINDKYIKED